MRILIGYGTTEGQTRKIARFAADRLAEAGHAVELLSLEDAEGLDPARFDAVILGGSVHAGGYQKSLKRFAADHAATLNALPVLFLSVSLTAAGEITEDWEALHSVLGDLEEATAWRPGRVAHIAGAYRFSEYNLLEAWMMRWIVKGRDPGFDGKSDKEYTDWPALGALIDDWTAGLAAGKEAPDPS